MTFTPLLLAAWMTAAGTTVSVAPLSAPVCAVGSDTATHDVLPSRASRVWQVSFSDTAAASISDSASAIAVESAVEDGAQTSRPRAKAFEYSDAYHTRLKIHKTASLATIPLFVTQIILGQKLYNFNGSDGVRTAHQIVAGTLAGLFALNSVTGVMNLWEGRKDPNRKKKVLVHGIMMLGADAGFTVAGIMAPSRNDLDNYQDRFAAHRAIALTSMAVATTAYLIMIFGK